MEECDVIENNVLFVFQKAGINAKKFNGKQYGDIGKSSQTYQILQKNNVNTDCPDKTPVNV